MNFVPPFLSRLNLDTAADARAVRSAYARELKRIDQEHDGEGFQRLRQAYEAALEWLAWQATEAQAKTEQDTGSNESCGERMQAAQHDLAEPAASGALPAATRPAALAVGPDAASQEASNETAPAEALLGPSPQLDHPVGDAGGFSSERELALDRVSAAASALPGLVLPEQVAKDTFRRFIVRSAPLRRPGIVQDKDAWIALLQACLTEDDMINISARTLFELHVASSLCDGWQPGNESLLVAATVVFGWDRDRHALLRLGQVGAHIDQAVHQRLLFDQNSHSEEVVRCQRALIARLRSPQPPSLKELNAYTVHLQYLLAHFQTWLALITDMRNVQAWNAAAAVAPPSSKGQAFDLNGPAVAAKSKWQFYKHPLFVVVLLVLVLRAVFDIMSEPEPMKPYRAVQAEDRGAPLSQARVDAIARAISYKPNKQNGKLTVQVIAQLDASGKVRKVETVVPSGEAAFDAAVETAIRSNAPFPSDTRRRIPLTFSLKAGGAELTQEQWESIRSHIQLKPFSNLKQWQIHLQVTLDEAGMVQTVVPVNAAKQGDRNAAAVAAVEAGIRAAAPFSASTPRVFTVRYASLPEEARLTRAQIEEIRSRVKWPQNADKGRWEVSVTVTLDTSGRVQKVQRSRVAGANGPAAAAAIEAAILASRPFPSNIARNFGLVYSGGGDDVSRKAAAARRQSDMGAADQPASTGRAEPGPVEPEADSGAQP